MTSQALGRLAQHILRQFRDGQDQRPRSVASRTAAASMQLLEPRVLLSGSVLGDVPDAPALSSGAPVVASFPAGLPVVVFDNGSYVDTDNVYQRSPTPCRRRCPRRERQCRPSRV